MTIPKEHSNRKDFHYKEDPTLNVEKMAPILQGVFSEAYICRIRRGYYIMCIC